MRIGFIKLGLKTYFHKDPDNAQGCNHELVTVFNLFRSHGHECHMISGSDLDGEPILEEVEDLDHIFVFNGPMTNNAKSINSAIQMKNYVKPYYDLLNATKVPWVYFWTDPRAEYDMMANQLITHKPEVILSQEKQYYAHLDKLILVGRELRDLDQSIAMKRPVLSVLMNEKGAKREKNLINICNWLKDDIEVEIRGKWKKLNPFVKEQVAFELIDEHLSGVRYSWNQTVDPFWTSQKYWEMVLNDVVCFHQWSDLNHLVLPDGDFTRVTDELEVSEKIRFFEEDKAALKLQVLTQRARIKSEYLTGEFIYETIMQKLCA